jgi:tetraacyldisaccharide 4'-kinase
MWALRTLLSPRKPKSNSAQQQNNSGHPHFMSRLESLWYRISPWHLLLWPLSLLYAAVTAVRRMFYRVGIFKTHSLPIPVIVVGNITAGGSGKTPLVIWLTEFLRGEGYTPGVISRGYGREGCEVREVSGQCTPSQVGDEPLLIYRRAGCPVFVGRDRVAAAQALLHQYPQVNVIISDDGLQHYRLARAVEICAVDGERGFGNGLLIPAGPLRESEARLGSVDAIVVNRGSGYNLIKSNSYKYTMRLRGEQFLNLKHRNQTARAQDFVGKKIHALAGIGNPARFFSHLTSLGLAFTEQAFPDHHAFQAQDIQIETAEVILMTEKDAVKCESFATDHCWALAVSAELDGGFGQAVLAKLAALKHTGKYHGP